jgi:hypothetical protein
VDLVLTTEELAQLASSDDWQPASAAAALTRAAFWACYQPALEAFLEIIGKVSAHAPTTIPAWLAAACHGPAASLPAAEAPDRLADLGHTTATRLQVDAPTRSTLISVTTDIARYYSLQCKGLDTAISTRVPEPVSLLIVFAHYLTPSACLPAWASLTFETLDPSRACRPWTA